MSDGEIIEAAPYYHLLSSSQEFQDLVNAHKETAGSDRLVEVTSPQKQSNSAREIRKTSTEQHYEASKGDQLIKQEEREKGDQGFKPYIQYLNQNKIITLMKGRKMQSSKLNFCARYPNTLLTQGENFI